MEKTEKKKKEKNRIPILILFILTLIVSGFAIYNIFLLDSIENLIRYVVIGIFLLIDFILFFRTRKIVKRKTKKESHHIVFILFMIFYLLINLVIGGVIYYLYGTVSGINKKWVTYSSSLVVKKDDKASKVAELDGYTIGILDDKSSPEGYIIPQEVIKEKKFKR